MIGREDLVTYITQLLEMERQMKTTYFFLQSQITQPELVALFGELEQVKQRHEDQLEAIIARLAPPPG